MKKLFKMLFLSYSCIQAGNCVSSLYITKESGNFTSTTPQTDKSELSHVSNNCAKKQKLPLPGGPRIQDMSKISDEQVNTFHSHMTRKATKEGKQTSIPASKVKDTPFPKTTK